MAMLTAGFSGGEAEELRRAFGFKRSERRMKEVEVKLRQGMDKNGIIGDVQDQIIHSITSFALYGFPESHAASFALIAYSSAFLKCHYLAAFTAAMLNNQPMGFYSPATLVKDAQRHGLKVKPIDVTKSDWSCTLENGTMRVGLRYVRGLRESVAHAIVQARAKAPFTSVDDLTRRVPELQKRELIVLADIGALNFLNSDHRIHRRDALWQVERASRRTGPLLESIEPGVGEPAKSHQGDRTDSGLAGGPDAKKNTNTTSPLAQMTSEERLIADFHGTGMTTGPHPMAYYRGAMNAMGVMRAADLAHIHDGTYVRVAGAVICRQRPGTAKGFVFLSLEDETGISNVIITPDMFDQNRLAVVAGKFVLVEGRLQNVDNVVSVKTARIEALPVSGAAVTSHDFH
jgi:error-prone DNA polymerase